MGSVDYWTNDLSTKLREVDEALSRARGLDGDEKEQKLVTCDELLKSVETSHRMCLIDVRQISARDVKTTAMAKLNEFNQRKERYKREVLQLRTENARGMLFGGRSEAGAASGGAGFGAGAGQTGAQEYDLEDLSAHRDRTLRDAHSIQDKTAAALERTRQTAIETTEIGKSALEEVNQQNERIHGINERLDEISSELDKAKEIMSSFIKRAMTDKLILIFVGLIVLAVIALVVYVAVKGK
mmetsp:Transcript_5770/g.14779  ORF Transcript_5770/g.14779 Transcript_5770/m.14779 type:complete len:241 (-) Transcript_5770:371-1093(-)